MRVYLFLIFAALLFASCSSLDGGKSDLPAGKSEDMTLFISGQWAEYEITRSESISNTDELSGTSHATIKISLVGEKVIQNTAYLWIEYLINQDKEQQRIVKVLADKKGAVQPLRVIIKNGKFAPFEIDLRRWETRTRLTKELLLQELTNGLNIIPLVAPADAAKSETENISVKSDGENISLACNKVILEGNPSGIAWHSEKTPFAGIVKAELNSGNIRNTIVLTAFGKKGAKTMITEKPIELDFNE